MPKTEEQSEKSPGWRLTPKQGRLVAALLIVAGTVHAFKPAWLTLDWPSIALILVGVLLLFVPLEDVGSVVESLEFGKTKILFRKVKELDDSVEQAMQDEISPNNLQRLGIGKPAMAETRATPAPAQIGAGAEPKPAVNLFDDPRMRSLLEADKEMALIRLGIEIERLLAELELGAGVITRTAGITWSRTINMLEQQALITPQIGKALTEFRNVRNQLIHPSSGSVPEALVTSAVDSGIKLLGLLSSIADMNQ